MRCTREQTLVWYRTSFSSWALKQSQGGLLPSQVSESTFSAEGCATAAAGQQVVSIFQELILKGAKYCHRPLYNDATAGDGHASSDMSGSCVRSCARACAQVTLLMAYSAINQMYRYNDAFGTGIGATSAMRFTCKCLKVMLTVVPP